MRLMLILMYTIRMATIVVVVVAVKKRADILVQLVTCCLCICVGDHVWWLLWVGYVVLLRLLYMGMMILWIVAAVVKIWRSCYPRMIDYPTTKWRHIWWRREHTTLPYQVTFQRLPLQLRNILLLNQPFIILLLLSQLSLQHPWSYLHVVHYIATIRVEPTIYLLVVLNEFLFLYIDFFLFSIVLFLLDNIFFYWFLFADGFILEEFACRYRLMLRLKLGFWLMNRYRSVGIANVLWMDEFILKQLLV